MKNKFEIVDEHQLIDYLNKGYEIIHSYQYSYTAQQNCSGTILSNSANLNIPVRESQTKFVLKRGPQAEVLFGEKNENQPANP